MKTDLKLLPLFIAVAQSDNFRAAADRLGITRSAVSQGMRKLEDSLGITLVQRSTRNVRLTEAGEQLYRQLAEPLGKVTTALEAVTAESSPRGLLRVAVTSIASDFCPGLLSFPSPRPTQAWSWISP